MYKTFVYCLTLFLLMLFISIPIFPNTSLNYLNRILSHQNRQIGKNIKRISKGTLLLTDNPANYAIYQKLEGQIRGLNKMIGNSSDMLSYHRYMGGILKQTLKPLQKIRVLILKRSNSMLSGWQRDIINKEIGYYYKHIFSQLKFASFNGIKVFQKILASKILRTRLKNKAFYSFASVNRLQKFFLKEITISGARANALRHRIRSRQIARENKMRHQNQGTTDYAKEIGRLKKNHLLLLVNIFMLKTKFSR